MQNCGGRKGVLWEMYKWRMAQFRNAKSLFVTARAVAQPFMRFTCECELIFCTKGCEPQLAFQKGVKVIQECLLKRVFLSFTFASGCHTLFFLCQGRTLDHNTAILLTLNASLFFLLSFSIIFVSFAKAEKLGIFLTTSVACSTESPILQQV